MVKGCTAATGNLGWEVNGSKAEMSLQVLAYNLQRVIRILGAEKLIAEMRA